jgi:diguanylate cyclase (GGDEF)-like protein
VNRIPPAAIPLGALVMSVPVAVAPGSDVADAFYTVAFVALVVIAWLGLRSPTAAAAPAHALVAGALTVWLAGDLLYKALTWRYGSLGGVSAADYLWVSGYLLLAAGLIVMTRLRAPGRLREGLLDGMAMATAVAAVVWQVLIFPSFTEDGFSLLVLVSAFYPFGDVLIFATVAILVLSPGERGGPTRYLVSALALTLAGDVGITFTDMVLPSFDAGRLDALLLLANSLLVAALWHPRANQLTGSHAAGEQRLQPARLVFLGVALTALPFMAIVRNPGTAAERLTLLFSAAALTAIVLVRFGYLIRDQEQARAALAWRATHDQLTGLVNRQELHARLDAALRRRASVLGPVVHFIDLDGFKPVNDVYGHAVGDRLLVEVARQLANAARTGDTVARLGGDEFVVLCREIDSVEAAEKIAGRLLSAVSAVTVSATAELGAAQVGASLGTAYAGHLHRPTSDDLLVAADQEMYRAKTAKTARRGGSDVAQAQRNWSEV